jgi:hypothetical protein
MTAPGLAAPLLNTLVAIAQVMVAAGAPWWIITGAAVALNDVRA